MRSACFSGPYRRGTSRNTDRVMDEDDWIRPARSKWHYVGKTRPEFAEAPADGQESVWDYPRPPRIAPDRRRIRVIAAGLTVADTRQAVRVLETSSPPTFYLPPADIRMDCLEPEDEDEGSVCEWKGNARYFAIHCGNVHLPRAAWCYPNPFPEFEAITDYISFYPAKVECYVDDERVRPQPGGFYGGWVTSEIVGPFKGEPDTSTW